FAAVRSADGRLLSEKHEAAYRAVENRQRHRKLRMIADDFRHPLVAEDVLAWSVLAVPRFHPAIRALRKVVPPACGHALVLVEMLECVVLLPRVRLRQVPGKK